MPERALPLQSLLDSMPNAVIETSEAFGQPRARVLPERAREALRLARDKENLACDVLVDLVAVAGAGADAESDPVTLIYQLASSSRGHRLRLVVRLDAARREADSASDLWPAAAALERELGAATGVRFRQHSSAGSVPPQPPAAEATPEKGVEA